MNRDMKRRIAMLTALVESAQNRPLGRTVIMKLYYLLSAIRGVSVGYHFTLYSYGPFDSMVLEDIDYAARLGAITVQTKLYPRGYGYEIQPGENARVAKQFDTAFVGGHREDVDWVIREFGNATAGELELTSTIVYVDREWYEFGQAVTKTELVNRVGEIKQHFSRRAIEERVENLKGRGMLRAFGT